MMFPCRELTLKGHRSIAMNRFWVNPRCHWKELFIEKSVEMKLNDAHYERENHFIKTKLKITLECVLLLFLLTLETNYSAEKSYSLFLSVQFLEFQFSRFNQSLFQRYRKIHTQVTEPINPTIFSISMQ